jgi:hypothetical protein
VQQAQEPQCRRRRPDCRRWRRAATMSTPTPLSNAAALGHKQPRDPGRDAYPARRRTRVSTGWMAASLANRQSRDCDRRRAPMQSPDLRAVARALASATTRIPRSGRRSQLARPYVAMRASESGSSGRQKQAPDSRAGCNATPFAAERQRPCRLARSRERGVSEDKVTTVGVRDRASFWPSDRPAKPVRLPDQVPPRQWSRVAALVGRCGRWWVLGVRQGETRSLAAVQQASGQVQKE